MHARTCFSPGAVLYEMATGRLAFGGGTAGVVFDAVLNRTPAAPVRLNPDAPPKLEEIINKLLDKDRRLRVLTELGQAASSMRATLGESLASIQKSDTPIGNATTTSLEALRAYTAGMQKRAVGAGIIAFPVSSLFPHFADVRPDRFACLTMAALSTTMCAGIRRQGSRLERTRGQQRRSARLQMNEWSVATSVVSFFTVISVIPFCRCTDKTER